MSDIPSKNKLLFDFYKNIKNSIDFLSAEDLEIAIKAMELERENMKVREQKRIKKAKLEAHKSKEQNTSFQEKVLYLPKNIKILKSNAFRHNKNIVTIVANEGLTEIEEYAFEGCTNLKEVVFPKNKITLRRGCFKGCSSIEEIYINDIASIGPSAFENCSSLKKVVLPSDISNIYSKAFKDCHKLHTITFEEKSYLDCESTLISSNAFENCSSLETIEFIEDASLRFKNFIDFSKPKEIYTRDEWILNKKFKCCNVKITEI